MEARYRQTQKNYVVQPAILGLGPVHSIPTACLFCPLSVKRQLLVSYKYVLLQVQLSDPLWFGLVLLASGLGLLQVAYLSAWPMIPGYNYHLGTPATDDATEPK